jgi:hypothetical protein
MDLERLETPSAAVDPKPPSVGADLSCRERGGV